MGGDAISLTDHNETAYMGNCMFVGICIGPDIVWCHFTFYVEINIVKINMDVFLYGNNLQCTYVGKHCIYIIYIYIYVKYINYIDMSAYVSN